MFASITPCDITLVRRKDQLAQMVVADGFLRSISDICLKPKHNLTTVGNQITGCSILTGGKMVFINYDPFYLLILNADGSTDRKIPLQLSYEMNVACIDQNTAAVR